MNSEVKRLLNMSILKEVSQKCFVFELQSFVFEGGLAEKLRFWVSKLQFWRKSRRKASFLSFKATFLKEVSQKSFVFEFQSFIFEGSLAEMLRFWASKLQFWRKSRRNASFLIFKASILKEVSQKSFVFELQSFHFKGSLAEMLRFWASKFQYWRKSCTKASLLSFKASFLKEISQKCFVFVLQSFNFQGSLAEKLRFWSSKLQFWRKSRRKASFLIFKTSILKEVSQKSFVWQPNHLNLKPIDNQITWISDQLTTESVESQLNWQPQWSSNQQTTKIIWSTHRLTTKSFESQISWQPNQLNLKSIDNQNHLNLKSDDNQIIWLSTRLNLTSIGFRTNWTPHTPFL